MLRSSVSAIALASATALLLAGGTGATTPAAEPDPPAAEGQPEPNSQPDGQPTDCIVGEWRLVVGLYSLDAEQYLLGLGLPIEGFLMLGDQLLTLTEDGLLLVETDLTSTGSIVTPSIELPFSIRTIESATAEWGWSASELAGDGTIEIAEYRVVESEVETPEEAAEAGVEPPVPALGDESTLTVSCDDSTLLLQGGGPLSAVFERR